MMVKANVCVAGGVLWDDESNGVGPLLLPWQVMAANLGSAGGPSCGRGAPRRPGLDRADDVVYADGAPPSCAKRC
jgi:hypothetical protein